MSDHLPELPSSRAVFGLNNRKSEVNRDLAAVLPISKKLGMVSCVHRKSHTQAGVSRDIIKSFECVAITDRKFWRI